MGDRATCPVHSWSGETDAGLHPATGGDGSLACSADMLLAALVACAGVTMTAVATAMEAPERAGYRGGPLEHGGHPLQCQYQLIPLFAFVAHAELAISEEAGEGATASRTVRLLALQRFDPPLRVLKRIFPAL